MSLSSELYGNRLPGSAFLALATLLLTACTTVETQSFRMNRDSQIESAKIAVDADFSQYDRLRARDM
ncbi:MAG: hypothetical protein AAGA33_14930, partial [Pseudomonadota bacterium]